MALADLLGGMIGKSAVGQSDTEPGVGTGIDQSKWLQFTQDRWNDLKNAYVVIHQSIWQVYLFYANQSWIDWDDARKVWQPQQPTDEWVPRPRINRFSPTVDAIAANFAAIPEVEAVPKDQNNPMSHTIAEVCTDLIDYAVVKEGLKHQQAEEFDKGGYAAQLFVLNGTVFSRIQVKRASLGMQNKMGMGPATQTYCPTCDKVEVTTDEAPQTCPECGNQLDMSSTEQMQPQMDELGNPMQQEVMENEICCDIGNSLWAFPRAGATSMADTPFLLWAQRKTIDDIWYRFNFEAQPDAIWPDGYSVTYEHALNFWYTGYSNSTNQIKDSCMVLEMYVPPEKVKDFPKGFYNVVINDKQAYQEEWDFPEHPLTRAGYLNLPTIFFDRSVAFDLAEIQREINAYESLIKLHAMVAAVDPIVVEADSIVNDITGRSDKLIKWRKTYPDTEPPHRMGSGKLDDAVYKKLEMLHQELQNISMAGNAFRGQQEGSITAAAAIQQLRAQAETMFSKPAANWRNFWRETLRKYVKFLQKYYSFEQLVKILGEGREEDVRSFMAADLDNVVDWVASDHGLPRTRDELRQEMMTMWQAGALDISDPTLRKKAAELFGELGLFRGDDKDAENAQLENQDFKVGVGDPMGPYIPPNIHPQPIIENMAVHMYFHKDQAKSTDFRKWDPGAQQALMQHILETQQEMMMQAMQMQAMQQPPQEKANLGNKNEQGQDPNLAQTTPTPAAGPGIQ